MKYGDRNFCDKRLNDQHCMYSIPRQKHANTKCTSAGIDEFTHTDKANENSGSEIKFKLVNMTRKAKVSKNLSRLYIWKTLYIPQI